MGMGRLSPSMSPSPSGADLARSHPSSPVGNLKERELKGRRDVKNRSGSVSIMQRATTALEAAGLVRKKSNEGVRDHHEKDRDREKSKEFDKKAVSGEEPRSSHGSSSSKLTKSPPMRALRDAGLPTTPPSVDLHHPQPLMGSPWVVTGSKNSPPQSYAPTPANSPGDTLTSLPNFSENNGKVPNRNRASLLSAFRLWFHEDRKGKQKEPSARGSSGNSRGAVYRNTAGNNTMSPGNKGSVKRRPSGGGTVQKGSRRGKRQSVSSRRSSSVNSKRSSGASGLVVDSPHVVLDQIPTRRSFGTHTPNSERGDYPSRPSSVRSFSMNRHRKSPSASSAGSAHFRTSSPIQKYHRRAGSGSSTRVVRQIQSSKQSHVRSNSATSSVHSLASSRPTSFYEPSENEGNRTASPYKRPQDDTTPRRTTYGSTTFVAQKRQTPFTSPGNANSIGRSSWKKSWGLEPPGWQSRATHLPVEVLAISPAADSPGNIRDVFSGRASLSLGDEDDWVDEDDDIPAFAGGLGQMPISSSSSSTFGHLILDSPMTLSPPPRGHSNRSNTKRTNRNPSLNSANAPSNAGRQKAGHSPVGRTSPVQPEAPYDSGGAGRRQLPTGRSGPAFRGHAIVEEDEGEEE
jgi:hypothetical protein